MISWFARNHVAANLLLCALLFLGLFSLNKHIPLEVFPSLELDTITVRVELRGASPQEMEQSVAIKIEEAIQDLAGIDQVTSTSVENRAVVSIEVASGEDAQTVLSEVERRVSAVNNLPSGIENPLISLAQINREVITIAVSSDGDQSEAELRQLAERIQDDLLTHQGISQVSLAGVRNYEIAITTNEATLRAHQLTLSDIGNAIRAHSTNQTAGNLKSRQGDRLLSTRGEAYDHNSFANIPIITEQGTVHLDALAQINDGFEETPIRSRFNGRPAAFVNVFRTGDESAIEIADHVKRYIDTQRALLPQGVQLDYWRDRSSIVKKRLNTLTTSALQGGVLVFILLTLFLRPQVAFWVFVGIPISFMGAFITMAYFGTTLNIISLFGFILVLGIVVDDAIVTGENIYSHQQRGIDPLQASIIGTREIAIPVTFGVLTTVAAFLPILFVEGTRGKFFAQIPAVVIPILLFSLIESKLILPAHLKSVKHNSAQTRIGRWLASHQARFARGFEQGITQCYRPLLSHVLHHRYSYLTLCLGTLVVLFTLVSSGWIRFTFLPRVPSEFANANLTMPLGSHFELTDRYIQQITDAGLRLKEKYRDPESGQSVIRHIQSLSGTSGYSGGAHRGSVTLELTPPEERALSISGTELVDEWRTLIGHLPGSENLTFKAEIGHRGTPMDIQIQGQSIDQMREAAAGIRAHLASYPSLFDITDSWARGKEEIQFELTPLAERLGFTRAQLIGQIRQVYHGIELQTLQRGRHEVRVVLRHSLEERQSMAMLERFLIHPPNSKGKQIPLSKLVTLNYAISPSSIQRTDRYRTLNIYADIDKKSANMVVLQRDLQRYMAEYMLQYPSLNYTMKGEIEEQQQSLGSIGTGLLLVLFTVYCLLAIPFKSYTQPLIVMFIIPFSLIGAIVGHFIMGTHLTIMSLFGMLALIGVVVNDGLVLVDFINRETENTGNIDNSASNLDNAITTAGVARFRPVMLTSLTTFIGLLPLLFEQSTQAQFLIPMAISLGFGILFATVLTLFLVPVNYKILLDMKALTRWKH